MRLGVMSDTHGNIAFMQKAADRMIDEFKVDAIIHLGDDYKDAIRMNTRGTRLVAIPGVFEEAWKDRKIKHKLIEEFGGVKFFLSHTKERHKHDLPDDIDPAQVRSFHEADVILHGHTHEYKAEEEADGMVVINPGHLAREEDRGRPPTFAIIDTKCPELIVQIIELDGALIDEFSFTAGKERKN